MANKFFYVHNGLTVGPLAVDASNGSMLTSGQFTITNTTAATDQNTGAFQVDGGVGINGSLYAGNIYDNGNRVVTTTGLGGAGVGSITAGTDTAVSSTSGAITIWSIATLQSITSRASGNTTDQIISITNTSSVNSATTGALRVTGGVGIGGSVFVTGVVTATTFIGALTGTASKATYIAGGAAWQIPYQSAVDTTGFINSGTTGQFLQATTNGAPVFTSTASIYVGRAALADSATTATSAATAYALANTATTYVGRAALADSATTATYAATAYALANTTTTFVGLAAAATNISGGTAGQLHYQSAAGITGFVSTGTAGQILVSAPGVPVYTNTASIYVGRAAIADSATTATSAATAYSWLGGTVPNASTFNSPVTFSQPVTFNGTATYVNSTNTVYTDNILELHTPPGGIGAQWTSSDGKDIGFRFHYYINGTDTNAALVLDPTAGSLEWYQSGAESTASVFTSATYGVFKTGSILIDNTTATNSAASGALQVKGGIGVGGGIFVTGNVTATTFVGALTGTASTATAAATAYALANTATTFVGLAALANLATTATSAATAYALANTATTFVGLAALANLATTATSAATAYALANTATTYVGRAALADSATTATNAATAYSTVAVHTAGTGLSGSTFNGSTGVTWTLNTSTLMQVGVTATYAAIAYSLANTATTYVGRAALADSATNIAGGAAWQMPYQSSTGTTAFANSGTTGQLLQATTNGAPTFVSTSSLRVGYADNALNVVGGYVEATTGKFSGVSTFSNTVIVSSSAIVYDQVGTAVGNTTATIDTFALATYRSAKYVLTISNSGNSAYQSTEVLVIHDGTTPYLQDVSVFTGAAPIMTFTVTTATTNVILQAIGTTTGNTVKVHKVYTTV